MPRILIAFAVICLLPLTAASLLAANQAGPEPGPSDATKQAIQHTLGRLSEAFNAEQADAVVAHFLPAGELVDEDGTVHAGRAAIDSLLKSFFERFPHAKMHADIESIRALDSDLVAVDMLRTVTTEKTTKNALTRSAVLLKKSGANWLIASLRDEPAESELSPHEHLKSLAWLVGEWVDEGADSLVEITCAWSKDQNFLLVDFLVKKEGRETLSSQIRIGWDPLAEQIRSWAFDTDGGYGEGHWTQVEHRWVFKSSAVLPVGTTGSTTFVIEPQTGDRFVMRGIDRIVGGEALPDTEVIVVRKPPQTNKASKR